MDIYTEANHHRRGSLLELFSQPTVSGSYAQINAHLSRLRDSFHKEGRLDDSNAKLDEIVKLISTYFAYKRGLISTFPNEIGPRLIEQLSSAFVEVSRLACFRTKDNISIFGTTPSLGLRDGDEPLAIELVRFVRAAID